MNTIAKTHGNSLPSKIISLLLYVSAPLAIGMLAVFFGRSYLGLSSFITPSFTAPDIFFSIMWPVSFALLGISLFLTANAKVEKIGRSYQKLSLGLWLCCLIINISWLPIFFSSNVYTFSFIWISLLTSISAMMTIINIKVSKISVFTMLPYTLFMGYMTYLNLFIALLN